MRWPAAATSSRQVRPSLVSKPAHTPCIPAFQPARTSLSGCALTDVAGIKSRSAPGTTGHGNTVTYKPHIRPHVGRITAPVVTSGAGHAATSVGMQVMLELEHGTVGHVASQVSYQHFTTQRHKGSIIAAAPATEPQAASSVLKTRTVHTVGQNYNFPTETVVFYSRKS